MRKFVRLLVLSAFSCAMSCKVTSDNPMPISTNVNVATYLGDWVVAKIYKRDPGGVIHLSVKQTGGDLLATWSSGGESRTQTISRMSLVDGNVICSVGEEGRIPWTFCKVSLANGGNEMTIWTPDGRVVVRDVESGLLSGHIQPWVGMVTNAVRITASSEEIEAYFVVKTNLFSGEFMVLIR